MQSECQASRTCGVARVAPAAFSLCIPLHEVESSCFKEACDNKKATRVSGRWKEHLDILNLRGGGWEYFEVEGSWIKNGRGVENPEGEGRGWTIFAAFL